ncbi:MAG: protein BatD [Legionellales bacterium]|nr:protein BatD [Legionellales bacterium]
MKKYLLLAILLWIIPTFALNLTASIDRNTINLGETFILTLTTDDQNSPAPQLQGLEKDFTILAQAKNSQVAVTNDHVEAKTAWIIQLQPKNIGNLTIPSITVGNQATKPIEIKVNKNTTTLNTNDDLIIKNTINLQSAYVQQQILYQVELYATSALANAWQDAKLTPPQANDMIVQQLGNYHYHQTTLNGKQYLVATVNYALFPQKSGTYTITPPQFHGNAIVSPSSQQLQQSLFNNTPFYSTSIKPLAARGKEITIDVQPQPAAFTGKTWLPAQQLSVEESWSSSPQHLKIGQPITRTITIKAIGLTAEQLPSLPTAAFDHVNSYPDLPQLQTQPSAQGVIGSRSEKWVYVPTQAGKINLPAITLPWWNTNTNQLEIAQIPAYTLTVSGQAATTALPAPSNHSAISTVTPSQKPAFTTHKINSLSASWSIWIAMLFAGLWLVTLGLWLFSRRKKSHNPSPTSDVVSLKASRAKIKQACYQQNPQQLKEALIAWAQARWHKKQLLSLGQINEKIGDDPLAEEIKRLDYVLYSGGKMTWDGQHFWKIFINYIRQHKILKKKSAKPSLPLLYPKK